MTKMRSALLAGLATVALVAAGAAEASAQNTKMPSSLRFGSGYFDAPVASVLPHLAITGTWSGFWRDVNAIPTVGPRGQVTGFAPGPDNELSGDASVALGLFNRVELGVSLQELESVGGEGNLVGFSGRLAILQPQDQGLGLSERGTSPPTAMASSRDVSGSGIPTFVRSTPPVAPRASTRSSPPTSCPRSCCAASPAAGFRSTTGP